MQSTSAHCEANHRVSTLYAPLKCPGNLKRVVWLPEASGWRRRYSRAEDFLHCFIEALLCYSPEQVCEAENAATACLRDIK